MKKIRVSILLITMLVLSTITLCYGDTRSEIKVVYNQKDLDFGDKSVVVKEGSTYIPLRALSEQLHFQVDWNGTTSTARIHDNLNDVYLSTKGDVKVNGVASKSDKVPLTINGSIYVPLRFVSETLGVNVNYDSAKKVVNMSGRDIYEISQQDPTKPYLIAYTKEGRKQVGLISDKTNTSTGENLTTITSVERTKYSDLVNTTYVYSGGLTLDYYNHMYVKNGVLIENSEIVPHSFDIYTKKPQDMKYFDDTVAILGTDDHGNSNSIIKIYDDKRGKVTKTINTVELYADKLNAIYKFEDFGGNGTTLNIQAVGKDFVVVNMLQPYSYTEAEDLNYLNTYYYTTVINLDTLEMTPVYEHLNYFKDEAGPIGDGEMSRALVNNYNITPTDDVFFEKINSDGTLGFAMTFKSKDDVNWNGERCSIAYK